MNGEWRDLLERALDGESLSDHEADRLREALGDEATWKQAAEWLQFEQAVSDRWQRRQSVARSRERLLAKSILLEKHAELARRDEHPQPAPTAAAIDGHVGRRWLAAAAIAAALLVGLWIAWPKRDAENYESPLARGDFRVLGPVETDSAMRLNRGDRLVSGGDGAFLALGGYCDVNLVSHTEVTVVGRPHDEAIELHQGGVRARITPNQGMFQVLTPIGRVQVKGTEFETRVEYPNGLIGDQSMNDSAKKVVVTVAVLSGAVLCQLGDTPVLLNQGARQVFAGEAENRSTRGQVTALTDFSVTLQVEEDAVTFHVPKEHKLAIHEVGQLLKGDRVTVSWVEEEGRKWIRDIDGEGVVEGTVTALGDAWIEIANEDGRKLRYRAPWRGGNPADGGGPDRDVIRKIGAARVGDRVAVTWTMPEGKRVVNVAVRGRGEQPAAADRGDLTKAPPELYGLSGRVIGRLVSKDVERGELALKIAKVDRVWRGNKAKNPHSAEGRTLKIDGVFGKFLDVLLTLQEGDGVQIEVKHVRGDGLTFLGEELKKVAIEDEREKSTDKPAPEASTSENVPDSDAAPAGLNGFRGILIGQLVSKDVERGTLVFKMEKVKRVWKQNKAPAPQQSVGKPLTVEGIAGKFLDTLLVLEVGDRIEVEAFHVRGSALTFPGEWLKKAEE